MISAAATWDAERTAELAREAYGYVARTYPPDAPLEPIGIAVRAVLEGQERGDWSSYVEALREMMRVAKREAIKRERVG